jgi:hypothetical protein
MERLWNPDPLGRAPLSASIISFRDVLLMMMMIPKTQKFLLEQTIHPSYGAIVDNRVLIG